MTDSCGIAYRQDTFLTGKMNQDPRVIVLTPPGRSAIATLRLEGADVLSTLSRRLTTRKNESIELAPAARPVLAKYRLPVEGMEEVILHVVSTECVEIHCHGSPLVIKEITDSFVEMGYSLEECSAWIDRTEPNKIAAEARRSLCSALTFRVAQILVDQYHGSLEREVQVARDFIKGGNLDKAVRTLDRLLQRKDLGRHLIVPWKVALVGPPNVGKSSLFNRLVGYDRAIVDPTPGTTRDFVTAVTAFEGWPIELCDTAGIRETEHEVEKEGVSKTMEVAGSSDLVVLVFSHADPWSGECESWLKPWPKSLTVFNKCDLPVSSGLRPSGLEVSALSGQGIKDLEQAILNRLIPEFPAPGTAVPFTERQIDCLQRAKESLLCKNSTRAEEELKALVGH